MQIREYTGEEFEHVAREIWLPMPDESRLGGRSAVQELSETLTLSRSHFRAPVSLVRTHVREHLAEPHLRVEELARRHNLSVRHVYTLFERTAPLTRKRVPARWPGAVN